MSTEPTTSVESTRAKRGEGAKRLAIAADLDPNRKEMQALPPEDFTVDWGRNASRAPVYTLNGKPCCFREEDVEDLTLPGHVLRDIKAGKLKDHENIVAAIKEHAGPISLLRQGQQQPIVVYLNAHKRPVVVSGNRRIFAFLVLAKYGLLDLVPVVHGKSGVGRVEYLVIEQPKDPEGWLRLAQANLAENGKKAATPVDVAWACRRFALPSEEHGEYGLGYAKAGEMVAPLVGHALSPRAVQRYIQLLSLPPDLLGKVHRGEVSTAAAIRKASEEGHGRSRGTNPGIAHTRLRRIPVGRLAEISDKRQPNADRVFTAKEVEHALRFIAGEADVRAPSWLEKLLEAGEDAARAAKEEGRKKKHPTNSKRKAA
jgi:hypothetical protein